MLCMGSYNTSMLCPCRSQAMGISSLGGRLGNMLSPFASLVVSKRARVFITGAQRNENHTIMIPLTGGRLD